MTQRISFLQRAFQKHQQRNESLAPIREQQRVADAARRSAAIEKFRDRIRAAKGPLNTDRLRQIAKALRELPAELKNSDPDGVRDIARELLIEAFENGAFLGDEWVGRRVHLIRYPSLQTWATQTGLSPHGHGGCSQFFAKACAHVADLIEREAKRKVTTASVKKTNEQIRADGPHPPIDLDTEDAQILCVLASAGTRLVQAKIEIEIARNYPLNPLAHRTISRRLEGLRKAGLTDPPRKGAKGEGVTEKGREAVKHLSTNGVKMA